jgi:hypothetical protein
MPVRRSYLKAAVLLSVSCGGQREARPVPPLNVVLAQSAQLAEGGATTSPEEKSESVSPKEEASKGPAALTVVQSGSESNPAPGVVGQLAILHQGKQVPPDYAFKVGDRVQFLVSCNKSGWLLLYHEAPGQARRLLWPESDRGDTNFIKAGGQILIPSGGAILFDDQAQAERFSLVIVSEAPEHAKADDLPNQARKATTSASGARPLSATSSGKPPAPPPSVPPQSSDKIIQIAIRGGMNVKLKGVTVERFQGGPATAFKAAEGDDNSVASIQFSLRHVADP